MRDFAPFIPPQNRGTAPQNPTVPGSPPPPPPPPPPAPPGPPRPPGVGSNWTYDYPEPGSEDTAPGWYSPDGRFVPDPNYNPNTAGGLPAPPAPGGGSSGYSPSGGYGDWRSDPIYLQALALAKKERSDAARGYLDQLKTLLLGYGSKSLAEGVINKLLPELTKYAGAQNLSDYWGSYAGVDNPDTGFSTVARDARTARENALKLREQLNNANLFYSGTALKQQGDLSYNTQLNTNQHQQALQGNLGNLGRQFLQAINNADWQDIQAAEGAYSRALSAAFATPDYGVSPSQPPTTPSVTSSGVSTAFSNFNANAPQNRTGRVPSSYQTHYSPVKFTPYKSVYKAPRSGTLAVHY